MQIQHKVAIFGAVCDMDAIFYHSILFFSAVSYTVNLWDGQFPGNAIEKQQAAIQSRQYDHDTVLFIDLQHCLQCSNTATDIKEHQAILV